MPPKKNSSRRRRRNPKLLHDKPKHKSLRGGNKKELHFIPNVDAHVISVATFLRMYPRSQSQDEFYTILRKTKTFQCFYSFVNEVFGNMDEQLFSVLFLSFMITTSGETSSFSFKDFIIRAVPNIDAAQIDEIDAGMVEIGNGLSKRVYEECVMMKRSSGRSSVRSRMSAVSRTRTATSGLRHRVIRLGGKRKIRKTRTNKKYVQTGGVLLFIAELIMILFEIRRRFRGSNESLLDRITPFLLLLFFILEITAQFSSIDYFGIGPGGSAAAVSSAAGDLTAFDAQSTGNLPVFIAGAVEFLQQLRETAATGEEGQSITRRGYAAGISSYASAQSTAAQGAAAADIITGNILFSQLSAVPLPTLEAAFELSPIGGNQMTFDEFQLCLDLPLIEQNELRIATLLRESQEAGMIPDSILEVPADEIHARLEQFITEFSSEFDRVMGGAGTGVQCAISEGRADQLNDRLSLQWSQHQSAMDRLQTAQEEHQFNARAGYFRLLSTCGLVLSSASSRNLLRRVYYITRSLLFPPHPLVDAARRESTIPGINEFQQDRDSHAKGLRARAASPQRVNPNETGLNGQSPQGNIFKEAAAAVKAKKDAEDQETDRKAMAQLTGWMGRTNLNPYKSGFDEFGLPTPPSP